MSQEPGVESKPQREFDTERERAAVKKMKDWQAGVVADPVMAESQGPKWWKAWVDRNKGKEKKKPGGKPEEAGND